MKRSSLSLPRSPLHSFEKRLRPKSFYIPTYSRAPKKELEYQDILARAENRYNFHRRLAFESKKRDLNYGDLRCLAIEFKIPFKTFTTNKLDITDDHFSFFSLMMVSLDRKEGFIKDEARLFLYRLKASGLSSVEIPDKFWTDKELRTKIIAGGCTEDVYRINFVDAFQYFDPTELNIQNGYAVLTIENIYDIVVHMFKERLMKKLKKFETSNEKNLPLIEALTSEFIAATKPKKEPYITLETYEEISQRSFPLCMLRISEAFKKSGILTFKARFELCLFLKGLGFDYYTQDEFWQRAKDPTLVNLKTIYGMSDGHVNYSPHACLSMINRETPKNVYQIQGCPFRFMAKSEFKMYAKKTKKSLRNADIEAIADKVPDHPQLACRMLFDALYKDKPFKKPGMNHPVEYFVQSEKRIKSMIW